MVIWTFDVRSVNGFLCKFHVFLTYFSMQFSSWILVLITAERCFSVLVPHKVRLWCWRRNGLMCLLCFVFVLVLLNGHFLVGMVHEYNPTTSRYCAGISQGYIHFLNTFWPKIDMFVTFATPFIIIITGNMIIIVKLAASARRRKHMIASDRNKTSSLTTVLLLLNTVFIISMGPSAVYMIMFPYLVAGDADLETVYFVFDIVNLIAGLNASLNFILYVASGSKFRGELKALLCCKTTERPGAF